LHGEPHLSKKSQTPVREKRTDDRRQPRLLLIPYIGPAQDDRNSQLGNMRAKKAAVIQMSARWRIFVAHPVFNTVGELEVARRIKMGSAAVARGTSHIVLSFFHTSEEATAAASH